MKFEVFPVDNDWQQIAHHLLSRAAAVPLPAPDGTYASNSESQMWRRVSNAIRQGGDLTSYSAGAIYQQRMLLSFVLTSEPDSLHLSMTRIIPGNLKSYRVCDEIANAAATGILGPCEERPTKGVLKNVRHFFRRFV